MDRRPLVRKLCEAVGVSGFEEDVRTLIRAEAEPLAHEVRVDRLGNLIAVVNPGADFTVMVDAHMDEIGFLVNHIDPQGLLHFALIGGWDNRVLPAQPVVVRSVTGEYLHGSIGMAPPHVQKSDEQNRVIPPEDLFIDLGASSEEEARERGIEIGAPGTLFVPAEDLFPDVMRAKSLDDRLGCAVALELLHHFSRNVPDFTLAVAFTTCEEVGLRGASGAAYTIHPDLALVLEATMGDTPGFPAHKQPTRLGKGAAVTIADNRIIVPRHLVRFLQQTAVRENIDHQYKTPIYGGTDAGAVHLSRGGVPTAVLSVPCRYIHSPVSLFRWTDYDAVARLAIAFIQGAREAADGVGRE